MSDAKQENQASLAPSGILHNSARRFVWEHVRTLEEERDRLRESNAELVMACRVILELRSRGEDPTLEDILQLEILFTKAEQYAPHDPDRRPSLANPNTGSQASRAAVPPTQTKETH